MAKHPKKEYKQQSIMEMVDTLQRQLNPLTSIFGESKSILEMMEKSQKINPASDAARAAFQQSSLMPTYFESQSAIARSAQLRLPYTMAFNFEESNSLLKMASQHELSSSAINIAGVANKAFQQSSLASINVVDHSAIAMQAQLRIPEAIAFKDTFLEMTKGMNAYNSVMSVRESMIHSMGGNSVYENMMESVNLVSNSVEPYRTAFDTARTLFAASESFKLIKDFQSQAVLADPFFSEYAGVFKQFESIHNLDSFKVISSLKNFPFEDVVRNNFDYLTELKESSDETILELDLEISERLSLVDDFNDLSIENQNFLLSSYHTYYYPIVLNCIVILIWLQAFLDEKLDLTNHTFILVEKSKEKLSYVSNVYRPNPSAIIDNVVAGGALMLLAKILGW